MQSVATGYQQEFYTSSVLPGGGQGQLLGNLSPHWQPLSPNGFLAVPATDLGEGGVLILGGRPPLIINNFHGGTFLSMSVANCGGPTVRSAGGDSWLERFAAFLDSVPQVEHAVDSSRTSIY